ncbi:hypothetical protein TSAR_017039, partial [Trichomalopsis sarcophagae]
QANRTGLRAPTICLYIGIHLRVVFESRRTRALFSPDKGSASTPTNTRSIPIIVRVTRV